VKGEREGRGEILCLAETFLSTFLLLLHLFFLLYSLGGWHGELKRFPEILLISGHVILFNMSLFLNIPRRACYFRYIATASKEENMFAA